MLIKIFAIIINRDPECECILYMRALCVYWIIVASDVVPVKPNTFHIRSFFNGIFE